jgi:hypothetical protein
MAARRRSGVNGPVLADVSPKRIACEGLELVAFIRSDK